MNLNYLAYFRVLGNMEHYTKAANTLNISQPSLSHAIHALEEDLGTVLFEKQGRNIKLTRHGKIYHSVVENALAELESGTIQLKNSTNRKSGQIDLAFIYTLGSHYVPTRIKDFKGLPGHEETNFSFHQSTTTEILNGLKEQRYDIGLCPYVQDEPDISFVKIHQDSLVAIVPSDHPLACYDALPLSRFAGEPLVCYDKMSRMRSTIDDLFTAGDFTPNIVCEVMEYTAIAGLVSVGCGIAVVPDTPLLSSFSVKKITITQPIHNRSIYLATLKDHYLTPSVCAFIQFLMDHRSV